MNIFASKPAATTVDQVLASFNKTIADLTAVGAEQSAIAETELAKAEAAARASEAAQSEAARAASVIRKIEQLLA